MKPFSILVLFLLFSLPAFPQQRWERTYGGLDDDIGYSVQQTTDGGYIVAGYTWSYGNGAQIYLIKTNAFGDTLWTRTFGDTSNEYGYTVQQTTDGGYVVGGTTYSFGNRAQVYLIKTNASGDTLWTRNYGGTGSDRGYTVQQTTDGGYIVAGMTCSFGNGHQVYLIKTNSNGDTLWTRNYGGPSDEWGYFVQQSTDGGYIIAGWTNSFGHGNFDVYLIRTNSSGDTLWTRTYGGANYDYGYSVQQTMDMGYIVAGATESFGNSYQVYLIKTNASGDTLWTRTYGGASNDNGCSVNQTTDGGYIVVGFTENPISNDRQVYLIKTDANGSSGVETNRSQGFEGPRVQGVKITPNPFFSFARVPGHEAERFSLYDISGRKVGTYKGDRIGEGLKAGVYFLRSSDSKDKPLRVVKVR